MLDAPTYVSACMPWVCLTESKCPWLWSPRFRRRGAIAVPSWCTMADSMRSMKRSSAARGGRVGARSFVALVLLLLPQSLVADPAEPAATAGKDDEAGVDYKASPRIPRKLLRHVLGCWQLDGQERWVISRLDASGAQVVTKLLGGKVQPPFPDRARRAAVPATLMYDARNGNFGFATAGRYHPTLVVFKQSGGELAASHYAKRTSKSRYAPTGHTAILQRCKKAPARKAPKRARRSVEPPRLR